MGILGTACLLQLLVLVLPLPFLPLLEVSPLMLLLALALLLSELPMQLMAFDGLPASWEKQLAAVQRAHWV